jgi:TRAP-type mannitol/chloroaromatic compound transport system substrate-binding protein
MSQPKAEVVNVDGKMMLRQGTHILDKAMVQQAIVSINKQIDRHAVAVADLTKDAALSLSPTGSAVVANLIKSSQRRQAGAEAKLAEFQAVVDQIDE